MSAHAVPDRYRGVWVRTLLETPTQRDDRSWVRWLQTGRWHADLRIPQGLSRPTGPLAGLGPQERTALAAVQGFCGITEVRTAPEGEVCAWRRRIDVQPPGLSPDEGWMHFETPERVVEIGVHGVYREVWERLPGSVGRSIVLQTPAHERGPGTRLLLAGGCLMRVRGRVRGRPAAPGGDTGEEAVWPAGITAGQALAEVVAQHPGQAAELLDIEISFGTLEAGVWSIERSTRPGLEGQKLGCALTREGVGEGLARVSLEDETRIWRVVEWRD